jgi:DNA-binding Lrp family transcriptional regulator
MTTINGELDKTDAIIIREMFVDARKSFSIIAKECGVSTANISAHYANLEKNRVIVGSTLQLDYKSLGYNSVCDLFIKCNRKYDQELITYINTMPNIYGAYKSHDSRANIKVVAILRNLKELDQTKDIIKNSSYITDLSAYLWTDIKNMPENLTLNRDVKKEIATKSPSSGIVVDNLDKKLIKTLLKNSQAPFNEIAKEIETSMDTAARRYKRMVQENIIKPCIQVDVNKLGYKASAVFNIAFSSQNDTESVIKCLTQIKDTYLIIKTSGDYDIRVKVMLRDIEQFLSTRNEVESINGINRLEANIMPVPFPFPSQSQYITTF